ncbi:hypothetical protein [Haloferax larsenii]|uniref:Uncharacterized protein n=1 Tax=Haloferax larsenii TaxID=302484 RepID=A0A1H7IK43_HALLR|nr:hypothetical protein [Haloferax larsenii]SEK62913.1 hypothetical protein SAMN04488691_101928 [Haloferax larsenii]
MEETRRSIPLDSVREATATLLSREFSPSTGHATAVLAGCAFAPSLLTFWFINGLLDFSTALAIGAVGSTSGLVVRLVAYLLLVPTFLLLRIGYYLVHPKHRRAVLAGTCPNATLFSLDWFSVGILATGLPLAFQRLGPWIGANTVYVVGLFVLPRVLGQRTSLAVKLGSLAVGTIVFLYASYGAPVAAAFGLPAPAAVLGPVATLTLSDATTVLLLRVTNSVFFGPVVVAVAALSMNRILTRPELTSIPLFRHTLPSRDPARIVLGSAALGTLFYLGVVAAFGGQVVLVP